VGIASAVFEKIVARASEREPSGSPIGARQPIQWKLADMLLQLDAARLLSLRAASACDRGEPFAYEAFQAKVFAGRAAARIADEAIQVLGGSGAIQDGGVERHWRDAKTTELNPISREAAQLAIARHLLEEGR
jgi:alkylation response protein AidB-like acyl-CoA dehydrogenase